MGSLCAQSLNGHDWPPSPHFHRLGASERGVFLLLASIKSDFLLPSTQKCCFQISRIFFTFESMGKVHSRMITLQLRDNRDFLLSPSSVQSGSRTRRGDLKLGDERGWQEGRKGETISRVSTATSPLPESNGGETGLSHLTISWIWCEHIAAGAVSVWKVFLDSFWLSDPVFSSWTQHEWCLGGCEVYLRSV